MKKFIFLSSILLSCSSCIVFQRDDYVLANENHSLMIYFDKSLVDIKIENMVKIDNDGGSLFLGHLNSFRTNTYDNVLYYEIFVFTGSFKYTFIYPVSKYSQLLKEVTSNNPLVFYISRDMKLMLKLNKDRTKAFNTKAVYVDWTLSKQEVMPRL